MARDELIASEAARICGQYRASVDDATTELLAAIDRRPKLRALYDDPAVTDRDLVRRRDYKDAVSEARKRLYYALRRYRPAGRDTIEPADLVLEPSDPAAVVETARRLLAQHASTAERLDDYPELLAQVGAALVGAEHVVDLGCGIHPLAYLAFDVALPRRYVALDQDPWSIGVLERFGPAAAPAVLDARVVDLTVGIGDLEIGSGTDAVMLKYLTVLERTTPGGAVAMLQLPFERVVVTGNREALAKRRQIAGRERRALLSFIEASGRPILGEIDVPSELGYVLGPLEMDPDRL